MSVIYLKFIQYFYKYIYILTIHDKLNVINVYFTADIRITRGNSMLINLWLAR